MDDIEQLNVNFNDYSLDFTFAIKQAVADFLVELLSILESVLVAIVVTNRNRLEVVQFINHGNRAHRKAKLFFFEFNRSIW